MIVCVLNIGIYWAHIAKFGHNNNTHTHSREKNKKQEKTPRSAKLFDEKERQRERENEREQKSVCTHIRMYTLTDTQAHNNIHTPKINGHHFMQRE